MPKLKQKRLALKLKLKDVAKRLQITPQCVQQQEQRGIQTIRMAKLYAPHLGCRPEDLLEF